jgi:hypothetical protein
MTAAIGAADTGTPSPYIAANAADAVADGLSAHGFDVRNPAAGNDCYLKVTNVRATLADLIISATGIMEWEYRCYEPSPHDPATMTAIVLTILNPGHGTARPPRLARHPHMTLKGIIGRAAADHGMHVTLAVLDQDDTSFDVYTEITVTNPAQPDRGTVSVADDGGIWWRCRLRDQPHSAAGLDITDITSTIARALTTPHAARQERPSAA